MGNGKEPEVEGEKSRQWSAKALLNTTLVKVIFCISIVALLCIAFIPAARAVRNTPNTTSWIANGNIYSMAKSGDTLYLGGTFTVLGPYTGFGAPFTISTETVVAGFPKVNGTIHTAVSDGAGGWYIGGSFTQVGSASRTNIAHINSDFTVDSNWNPNADGIVYTIAVRGSAVYAGGDFTTIGSVSRSYLAALDSATGIATGWNPSPNLTVLTLALSTSTLYVGGNFTAMGATTRNFLAAFDTTTGNLDTSWNPNADVGVRAIATSTTAVYVGGGFGIIGGATRANVAALNLTTGAATSWIGNANNIVAALYLSGSTLYAGGYFTTIGGNTRNRIAALNTTTGSSTSWNPNANEAVLALASDGTSIFAGGGFTTISGVTRYYQASLNPSTAAANSWDMAAGSIVRALAVDTSRLYVGGDFTTIGGATRTYLGAIDLTTGQANSWSPTGTNGIVWAIAVDGSTVYAGGDFTTMGGSTRNYLAAINASTGNVTSWNPNMNERVSALLIDDSTLYAGGSFTSIAGTSRNYIAALNTISATSPSWNPNANGAVMALASDGAVIYAGGGFTRIGDASRNYLAALTISSTGTAASWNPSSDNFVSALALGTSTVYAGGLFTSIGGDTRNYIASISTSTGSSTAWNPNGDGEVKTIGVSTSSVYVGGSFTTIGGASRGYLAALNKTSGSASAWDPSPETFVRSIVVNGASVHAGGDFTTMAAAAAYSYYSQFDSPTVQFSSASGSGAESATTVSIPITLSATNTVDVTVAYSVSGGTASGNSVDYDFSAGTVTFTAGNSTANITLNVIDDSLVESSETVIIALSDPAAATFGSNSSFTYTITNNDTENFSGGTGGRGGPPPPPTPPPDQPPVISDVVTLPGVRGVRFTWVMHDDKGFVLANIQYGTTTAYGTSTKVPANEGNNAYNLFNLSPSTTYYFEIMALDTGGHTTTSKGSFQTKSSSDVKAPIISDVVVVPGATTAEFSWKTDEVATYQMPYGTSLPYDSMLSSTGEDTQHRAFLSQLVPDTVYHFQIIAIDLAENTASTQDATFKTVADRVRPPNVENLQLQSTPSSIKLTWVNPSLETVPDFFGIQIIRAANAPIFSPPDAKIVYDAGPAPANRFADTIKIFPGIEYYYRVITIDTSGNTSDGVVVHGRLWEAEKCDNSIDDDSNGFTDCADQMCQANAACQNLVPEICDNTLDDDKNGLIDCGDNACVALEMCTQAPPEQCTNNIDDDKNGLVDCKDPVCSASKSCSQVEQCANKVDDNHDGATDCDDAFCQNSPLCVPAKEICDNNLDDNDDGLVDCFDAQCKLRLECKQAAEVCDNGVDDDRNGLTDCLDASCSVDPVCVGAKTIAADQLIFLIGNQAIQIVPQDGTLTSLTATPLTIGIPAAALPFPAQHITLSSSNGAEQYIMPAAEETVYYGEIIMPPPGVHQLRIEVTYENGNTGQLVFQLRSLPLGLITGEGESVPSAEVALYDAAGNQVNTAGYGQANPQTAAGGAYGWIVPNGSYYLTISSVGFYDRTTPLFTVSNHIVNRSVNLILAPPLLTDIIDPDAPLLDNALTIAKNLRLKAQSSVKRALQTLTDLADNPTVEKTTREVVVPTVVTAAAFGTLALVPWWDIISLLRLLFLQPLLLLGRGRRRGWGQVYNALNKLPIDLATLRLIDKETGKVVQTKVTDKEGRYAFVAPPGAYTIAVNKAGMLFPSALLGAITADGRRPDIYHGETIRVNDESAVITANIPLDPSGEHKRPSRLFWYQVGRAARLTFSWIGIIITAVSLYIAPVWYVWVLFGLHICLFFVFRRLAIPPKIKSWGIVYDAASKEPVRQAVARLFNLQFNKLVATQITDRKGRYYFLAGDDAYYVSYDHNNYAPTKSTTIDLKGKEAETITLDVGLNKPNNKRASLDAGATLNKNKLPPEKNFGVKTRF